MEKKGMGITYRIKQWIKWALLIPDDDNIPLMDPKVYERQRFELWAFGAVDSHKWDRGDRERLWNSRHGSVYMIPMGQDMHAHMRHILKLYKYENNLSEEP